MTFPNDCFSLINPGFRFGGANLNSPCSRSSRSFRPKSPACRQINFIIVRPRIHCLAHPALQSATIPDISGFWERPMDGGTKKPRAIVGADKRSGEAHQPFLGTVTGLQG
jgi:hypothetical protein